MTAIDFAMLLLGIIATVLLIERLWMKWRDR